MRALFAPVFWLGRVTLWVLFFPLGIWRSVRHAQKKNIRRQEKLKREELELERQRIELLRRSAASSAPTQPGTTQRAP